MPALSEIMSSDVFEVDPDAPVSEVAAMMVRRRFGSAVVKRSNMVAGIFTERDVLRAAASGADLTSSPVRSWMTEDPVTARPDTDSEDAAQTMLSGGFRHLPVEEGTELVGIVSLRDVLSARIGRS